MIETTPTTNSQPYKPTIRHTGGTRYDVQSRTRPERIHHTDVYHLTCDCEAGSYGKRCWALALAISYDAWRRQEGKKARIREQVSCTCAKEAVQRTSAPVPPAPAPVPHAPAGEGDWHASAAQGDRHASAETGMRALQVAFE